MRPNVYIIVKRTNPLSNTGQAYAVANPDWSGDWERRYFPGCNPECVQAYSVDGIATYGNTPEESVSFNEYLVSSQGAGFTLFIDPEMTPRQTEAAKADLRHRFDVVTTHIFHITKWKEPEPDTTLATTT